jgi:hypothetical protein
MLNNFEEQRRAIAGNGELSDQGKQNAYKRLDGQVAGYRSFALSVLRADWSSIRKSFTDNEARRAAAAENAAKAWDFQRLNYEKAAIEAQLKKIGHDLPAVQAFYTRLATSGDKHKARVAAELGLDKIPTTFGLIVKMRSDLEALTTTDEMAKVEKDGQALAGEAISLFETTKAASAFYGRNTIYGRDNGFEALLDGVAIQRSLEKNDAGGAPLIATTVSID